MEKEPSNANGKMALLTTLASSGDNWVKLGIMVMVGISGLGNFVATTRTSDDQRNLTKQEANEVRTEIRDIYRKVDDLHGALDGFEGRQNKMLSNQQQLIEADGALLKEIHIVVVKLDTWKQNEEMRGAQ
jgi:phage-related tail protein